MHPVHHLSALKALLRRHEIALPPETPFSADLEPIERYGLVLHTARRLIKAGYATRLTVDRSMIVDGVRFAEPVWSYSMGVAAYLAMAMEEIADGRADYNGAGIDRMAITMLRLEQAGIATDADALAREGIAEHLIIENGFEAVQLAEAIKSAIAAWLRIERREAGAVSSEAA